VEAPEQLQRPIPARVVEDGPDSGLMCQPPAEFGIER
jgi:hypothetical protein